MTSCPREDRLEQLLEDNLAAAERDELSTHVAACPCCQEALERLTESPESLRGPISLSRRPASDLSVSLLARLERPPEDRPPAPASGELPVVDGYQVEKELGRGGMGVVYQARHLRLNRIVALKMILSGPHAGAREEARFRQEAEAVAQLHHPNIVQIFDVGEANGHPFCALELVDGGSLVQYLRDAPQPTDVTARLVEVLARTVHFAHERGIVHRDLKPANILLQLKHPDSGPRNIDVPAPLPSRLSGLVPKITDFGLAKRLNETANATVTGELVGTPSYMAPEQAAGPARRVGPLADVYALGAILYEMLTGHPPFKGPTALDTVLQVLHEEPVRPARLRPDVPRDLETICLKCLEKSPSQRYSSARALADDLRLFRRGDPILARPIGPRERFLKWVRRRPTAAGLVGGIILITLLGFAGVTWQWRETAKARDDALQANNKARAALYRSTIAQSQLRWRLNDFSGAKASLESFLREPGQEAVRGWEWRYLEGLYATDLLTLKHPEGGSSSGGVSVSPDGRRIASVISGQQKVYIWSAADGEQTMTLPASPGAHRVLFRGDGVGLAVADNTGGVTVWDLNTLQRRDFHPHAGTISSLAFSQDGRWLATASWDGTVKVQDAASGAPRMVKDETGAVKELVVRDFDRAHGVAFSPDGKWLAAGGEGTVKVKDAATGEVRLVKRGVVHLLNTTTGENIRPLEEHKSPVYGVTFSPDGKRLASAGSNGNVRLWDLALWMVGKRTRTPTSPGPRVVQSLTGNAGAALSLAFSPDGRYLAYGGSDATVCVWGVNSGVLRIVFRGHTAPVEGVRFSPNGRRLVSCCPEQGEVKVWDLTRHPEYSTLALTRHPEYPGQDPTGTWPEVKVWDMLRGSTGPTAARTGPDVEALAFQGNGERLVSVTVGGRLQTWDTASGMLLDERPLPLTGDLVSPAVLADFSPDGRSLAGRRNKPGDDGRVVGVWDVNTAESRAVLKGCRFAVFGVRFNSDGLRVATVGCDRQAPGRPHEVKVWDAVTGNCLRGWEGKGHLFSLAFSPDGRWLAMGGEEGQVKVVEWVSGKVVLNREGRRREHRGAVTALAFSRDGKRLASAGAGDQEVKIWDCATWRATKKAEAPGLQCDLVFSQSGRRLAGISRDVVKLWDVETGQELLSLRGAPQRHRDPAFNARLAFSPDGRRLAGSNWDESISVWEAETPSKERQEGRREAADRRAPLWHLQEAEHCVLVNNPYGKDFHLSHIGNGPLPGPLMERKKHLLGRKAAP